MTCPSIEQVKPVVEILQSIFTILAIIGGAAWSLAIYKKKREGLPKADVSVEVICKRAGSGHSWLHVTALIRNLGQSKIDVGAGHCRVQLCEPLSEVLQALGKQHVQELVSEKSGEREIGWPSIASEKKWNDKICEIEPGEADRLHFDFMIPGFVESVFVDFHFKNLLKAAPIGWGCARIFTLFPGDATFCGASAPSDCKTE